MGKWFTPNAVCYSQGLEGIKRLLKQLLRLTHTTRITSISKHRVKYPNLPSAHSEELSVPQPLENLTFSDDNSDSDEDHGQQEGDNVDCDLTLKQVVPHLNQEILTILYVI
jgi:hypothetical protein